MTRVSAVEQDHEPRLALNASGTELYFVTVSTSRSKQQQQQYVSYVSLESKTIRRTKIEQNSW